MLILTLILLLFICIRPVQAIEDPLAVPNNQYGIHVADVNELAEVAELVNSTGGDWGYVTLVIQEGDRDLKKWQAVFDQLRRLHLIPLVRLATQPQGETWALPRKEDLGSWVDFLNSLNWPVKNRYVIVFNEPNHGREWQGFAEPEVYGQFLVDFSRALKAANEDFFILPAGLDFSASSDGEAIEAVEFLTRLIKAQPEFCQAIDGWNSHSYPNPGFSASPLKMGRGSLQSFNWELNLLKQLGCQRDLPVFITETGWQHRQGERLENKLLTPEQVADYITLASQTVWQDQQIVAITPFIFSYQGYPFDHFSWKVLGASNFYSHYYAYQNIPKVKGQPEQEESFDLIDQLIPESLVAESVYSLQTQIANSGQSILDQAEGYQIVVTSQVEMEVIVEPLPYIEPSQSGQIGIHLKTPAKPGVYTLAVKLFKNGRAIKFLETQELKVVPPPALVLNFLLGWRQSTQVDEVEVIIYDQHQEIIHQFTGQQLVDSQLKLSRLFNLVPGDEYRVVGLVPYYLPRQKITTINTGDNQLTFERFWPLDLNQDGRLSIKDYFSSFKLSPAELRQLFF